ncbi:MAG: peptidylprolyl isomerase [Butyrivibrio sp.]|nr:peptidylprolyl isomerase [Butyrivibrio sp.]
MLRRRMIPFAAALCAVLFLTGCALRLTTGLDRNTLAKVNGGKIGMDCARLLLSEMSYSYERLFDAGVWSESIGGVTAQEYVKTSVKDTLLHLKVLGLMAERENVAVSEAEEAKLSEAARAYWATLPQDAQTAGFDVETVRKFYGDLLLAEKVFYEATADVDTEVSADEARVVDVQYIFVSTMKLSEDGEAVRLPDSEYQSKKTLAESLLSLIPESDFAALAREYSDDSEYSLQFGSGERDAEFEKAAFALEMGGVSGLVETEYGYYIIKCINDNIESNYEKRREEIILSRRTEAFSELYAEFARNIETEFNEAEYEKLEMKDMAAGSGQLYDVFGRIFVSTQLD